MPGKSEHFVPQHYLRQFCFEQSERIIIATVAPFRFIGPGAIKGQCQEDYFYGKDKVWDDLLTACEGAIAPVLTAVCSKKCFDDKELGTLRLLAVILHKRTRKTVEAAKVTPRYMVTKAIKSAINRGELPPYPDGEVTDEMWDFKGVPGFMLHLSGICLMEMQTLGCKLLESPIGSHFITSDNPAIILNQFCMGVDPNRGFAGFSKSGFQLLLPISPTLCLFFYDENIYKVGNRRDQLVKVSKKDVEIINSLQVQSADKCLYFHSFKLDQEVQQLVVRYSKLRVSIEDSLRVVPQQDKSELLQMRKPSGRLPAVWKFCLHRKHIKFRPGDLRKPGWTALGKEFMRQVDQNPTGENIFARLRNFHGKFIEDSLCSTKT